MPDQIKLWHQELNKSKQQQPSLIYLPPNLPTTEVPAVNQLWTCFGAMLDHSCMLWISSRIVCSSVFVLVRGAGGGVAERVSERESEPRLDSHLEGPVCSGRKQDGAPN